MRKPAFPTRELYNFQNYLSQFQNYVASDDANAAPDAPTDPDSSR